MLVGTPIKKKTELVVVRTALQKDDQRHNKNIPQAMYIGPYLGSQMPMVNM